MKNCFTLLLLLCSSFAIAQTELTLICPEPTTVACIDAIPAPDLTRLSVQTDCNLDFDGNVIVSTNTGSAEVCDTSYIACYSATPISITALESGETRVAIEITYGESAGCRHAVSHVAFSLPAGTRATDFSSSDTYTGQLGTYHVENTTNNPYYSIKFESNGDGFVPGTKEVFVYTLPEGVAYEEVDILVKASTNRDPMTLSLACTDGSNSPVDTVVNYEVFWIYDYVMPGGSGCIGDPIAVVRTFTASDACYNSSFCEEIFYVESECINGVPVGCESDSSTTTQGRIVLESSTIWRPEEAMYAVNFSSYKEHEGGYYSISKQLQARGGSNQTRELGRLAPSGQDEYNFVHESISLTDSILVEWVGESAESSSVNNVQHVLRASVYPNPGSAIFTITFPEALVGNANVIVYDQLGRKQPQVQINRQQQALQLNGQDWPMGLYRIQVVDEAGASYQATWIKR